MTSEASRLDSRPAKREFRLEHEYQYNRSSAVRWIISHLLRYPHLPLIATVGAVLNNFAYGMIQVLVGRAFDLISSPGWATQALVAVAFGVFLAAVAQGTTGLIRNFSTEFIAQRIERDGRDELYVSLLGKSQTFHGRQRIGDIMARATNDVRQLNFMFSPGLMLILDTVMGIVVPIFLISQVSTELLLVPVLFLVAFGLALWDYTRQLNPVSMAQREQFGVMNSGLAETIAGIEVVKGNVQEEKAKDNFASDAAIFRDYFVKQGEIQARYLPLLLFRIAFAAGFLHALL
ncbi:MAG: ABC transporter ATP-binding protein, partial [Chloroflexota bacterium]